MPEYKNIALSKIRRFYHETAIGNKLLHPVKIIVEAAQYNYMRDKAYIERKYETIFGCKPDLVAPKTFNEKLQWLKLNDRTRLHTLCADKYAVRQFVSEVIGSEFLIPLLLETNSIEDIYSESLPDEPFVIKTNHCSGKVFIVTSKTETNFNNIRKCLRLLISYSHYHSSREWQYKNIKPRILVEKFITDTSGSVPKDYKIFCFDGKAAYVQVDSDRFGNHKRTMFDANWNEQAFSYKYESLPGVERPPNLDKMLRLAEMLSLPFSFARIDFYDTGNAVYFGEITFHPESGFGPFVPAEWDMEIGKRLNLRKARGYQ